ncbi:type II secretion system protein [Halarcobacter anaerophilus]|uniref:type II secretion system protein n=1 Tax=Halarcobacter anaerophilus TaxID=877500 RepID=UPI0005CAA4B9|nr:type II secretion system protein [Halarcobacter anaerophilus]
MKKAFSLMEVMIATALLSVVLLTLIQSGENSIYFLEKSKKTEQNKQYLQIALDTNSYKKRNENIYLEKEYNNLDDEVRLELKKQK